MLSYLQELLSRKSETAIRVVVVRVGGMDSFGWTVSFLQHQELQTWMVAMDERWKCTVGKMAQRVKVLDVQV